MQFWNRLIGMGALVWIGTLSAGASAAVLTAGNILVSAGNLSSPANRLYEYTTAGGLVQTFTVPSPTTADENLRDVAVGFDGKAYVFNGSATPYLTVVAPGSATYAHYQGVGFSCAGNVTYGGVAVTREYAFVNDMNTGNSAQTGIVRFSLADFSSVRFEGGREFDRVSLGADGLLYALTRDSATSWSKAEAYNPVTMALVRSVIFTGRDIRAIAASASGEMYCAGWDGFIYAYDSTGNFQRSRDTGLNNVYDVDLSVDGKLVASDWGHVVMTDTTLASQTTFTLSGAGPLYVAFTTPLPEPGCAAFILLAAALVRGRQIRVERSA